MHKILANTFILGKDIHYLPECHSTNAIAHQRYKEKTISEGGIILTDRQTAGRGQRGNRWFSEPLMNLTFSLVLTPAFLDIRDQFGLNMAIALGIRKAISAYAPDILVKWPNDLVHEKAGKLGGILIENTINSQGIEVSIVGIGLNINQTHFPFPGATSIAQLTGEAVDKEEIFKEVISNIEKYYLQLKNIGESTIKEEYLTHLFRFEKMDDYFDEAAFVGKIIGISEQGKLIIEKEDQAIRHYTFKEVRFV